jgi:chromosome partitioning protein
MIRANVKLAEAPSFGRTIFEHAPDSNGAQDYAALATEFLSAVAPMTSITPEGEPAKEVGAS